MLLNIIYAPTVQVNIFFLKKIFSFGINVKDDSFKVHLVTSYTLPTPHLSEVPNTLPENSFIFWSKSESKTSI